MKKTKIDWADSTWNPVTGCQHECEYCYARGIANRFGGFDHDEEKNPVGVQLVIGVQELDKPKHIVSRNGLHKAPYPWGFLPTLHRYKIDEPARWMKPRNIFVCSMADLFGAWVPDEWIKAVFAACEAAPQHRYLFLTKNPARYIELHDKGLLPDGACSGQSAGILQGGGINADKRQVLVLWGSQTSVWYAAEKERQKRDVLCHVLRRVQKIL